MTHLCGHEHFDPKALAVIMDIATRLRSGSDAGCLGPQDVWFDDVCPSLPVALLHNPAQTREDARAVACTLNVLDKLKIASDAISKIQDCISRQINTCETRVLAFRTRGGFSSLPDEILTMVLEHAMHGDGVDEYSTSKSTARAATRLSHVCQRFRHLVFRLWCGIFDDMDMDMVSSSCDRLSKTRGEIFFGGKQRYNTTTCIDSEVFVRMVARQSRHWLRFVQGYNWLLRATYSVEELKKLARITRRLNTPFLSELDIRFPSVILMEDRHRRQDVRDAVHYYSTWSMPKLRSLVMENLLPIPCFAPVSLTNLDITLNFEGYMRCYTVDFASVNELGEFLASCPVLQKFSLRACNLKYFGGSPSGNVFDVTSVQMLDLSFENCVCEPIGFILDSLRFPSTNTIKLNVKSRNGDPIIDNRIQTALRVVIPDADTFPHLKRLDLSVDFDRSRLPPHFFKCRDRLEYVSIPFPSFAKVQHLTLTSNDMNIGSIPEGACLPALRSLALKNCRQLRKTWVSRLVKRLKSQGNIPQLQLTVVGCLWRKERSGSSSDSDDSSSKCRSGDGISEHETAKTGDITEDQVWGLMV